MQIINNFQADGASALAVSATLLDQTAERVIPPADDIVTAAQAGSPGAFEELYATYSGRLYKTIFSIIRNPDDAEEALQDTFLRAYLAIKRFERKCKIYTWLTRIAINSALMILRKQRIRPEVSFAFPLSDLSEAIAVDLKDSAPSPEELCVQHQHQLKVLSAIRRLNQNLQTPIRLQLMDGWSVKEISRALNISEAAVKSRLCRARQHLSTARGNSAAYAKTVRAKETVVITVADEY